MGYVVDKGRVVCVDLVNVGKCRTEGLWLVEHSCSDIGCMWLGLLAEESLGRLRGFYHGMHAMVERYRAVLA
jgi:hypothetical protein